MASGKEKILERLVEELKAQMPMKETTEPGDLVLMLRENDDGQVAMVYARVMGFIKDDTKRDEWWHVRFVFLEVPPLPRTIILQTPHFTGQEIFTMGGRKVFIKALNFEALDDEKVTAAEPSKKAPAETESRSKGGGKPTFRLIK